MIAYYAMTKFHLIFSITHKIKTHGDEKAILFLYSGMQDIEGVCSRLSKTKIFENIYVVDEISLRQGWKPLSDASTEKDIQWNLEHWITNIKEWLPVPISRKDTLYIANDHWSIGAYCIYNKIPYTYYEDGVGMLSQPEYSYQLVRNLNVTHAILADYLKAFGLNDCVIKKLADMENQQPGFQDEKAEHFSLKEMMKSLPSTYMEQIINVFGAEKVDNEVDSVLLLTEHFVNMKRLSIEEHMELYGLLVDFFAGDKQVYIKQHPNDFHVSYKKIFEDAKFISRNIPSELLPYNFSNRIDLGLAACSTSVFGLKDILNDTLRFDSDIEKRYLDLFKYYLASIIIGKLHMEYTVYSLNCYEDMLNAFKIPYNLLTQEFSMKNGKNLILVDRNDKKAGEDFKLQLEGTKEKDVLVFLGYTLVEDFLVTSEADITMDDWAVLEVTRENVQNKEYLSSGSEYIWVYSKDRNVIQSIRKIGVKKEMKHTGLSIDVTALTDDEAMKVKFLQGNVEALTNKLDYYIENEKNLNARIRELEKALKERDSEMLNKIKEVFNKQ